jgi:hypothetical protein
MPWHPRSRTLLRAELKGSGTPEQTKAHFQRIGMSPVALPDVLRKPQYVRWRWLALVA